MPKKITSLIESATRVAKKILTNDTTGSLLSPGSAKGRLVAYEKMQKRQAEKKILLAEQERLRIKKEKIAAGEIVEDPNNEELDLITLQEMKEEAYAKRRKELNIKEPSFILHIDKRKKED